MPDSYSHQQRPYEPRGHDLRASDYDRDRTADILREQHLAGRLETDEFQERLDRCYAAKTYRQLDELVADLPSQQPTRATPRTWRRWPVLAVLPLLLAAIALSHGHLLWVAVPLFFFVARPLLWRAPSGRFGAGFAGCGARQGTPSERYL
jgi:uncharacterized protein DUF1707